MGSAAGTIREIEVEVAYSKKSYPPPSPPKFKFRDLYKHTPVHDEKDLADEGFDWLALDMSLRTEESRQIYIHKNKNNAHGQDTPKTDPSLKWQLYSKEIKLKSLKGEKDQLLQESNVTVKQDNLAMVYISRQSVDQHATSTAITEMETFEALFEYLRKPIQKGVYEDAIFIRALLVWLGYQNIEKGKYGLDSLESPIGILEHIKRRSLTYTKAFTLLSRAAGIPCVLIDGYVKAGIHEPGDNLDTTNSDTWCAVFVDRSWQLIHPLWVIKGNYGNQTSELILIDSHDIFPSSTPSCDSKRRQIRFNEEYFMPPPDEFSIKCWPKNSEWQLLPLQSTAGIQSLGEFYESVYITSTFLKFRLKFTRRLKSILHSVDGKVRIEIDAPTNMASRLLFHCVLKPKEIIGNVDDDTSVDNTDLARFVLSFRSNERIIFDLRLPFEGKYKVEISGGIDKLYMLCRFMIVCTEPMNNCKPLPVDADIVGWGPGPKAERSGLILPSNPSGLLTVLPTEDRIIPPPFAKPENITYISFQLGRKALLKYTYSVDLRATFHLAATNSVITTDLDKNERKQNEAKAASHLSRCVEGLVDHASRLLRIRLTVPREGEYALVIKTTEFVVKKEKKIILNKSARPVCYYLLSAHMDSTKQYTPEKLARRDLQTALSEGSIERIQAAVIKCRSVRIPLLDNVIAAADLRLEYMKIRRDLQECLKRRNGVVINDTLKKVIKYRYRSAFVDEVEQILLFKNELLNLQGYPRGIYSLKEANEEIIKIVHPLPEVHNTIKALLLMLGYYGNMDDWPTIQSTLKLAPNTLNFTSVLKQLQELEHPSFPWQHVKRKHIEKVDALLHRYTYDAVIRASQAAALLYRWVERCISMIQKKRKIADNYQNIENKKESKKAAKSISVIEI